METLSLLSQRTIYNILVLYRVYQRVFRRYPDDSLRGRHTSYVLPRSSFINAQNRRRKKTINFVPLVPTLELIDILPNFKVRLLSLCLYALVVFRFFNSQTRHEYAKHQNLKILKRKKNKTKANVQTQIIYLTLSF